MTGELTLIYQGKKGLVIGSGNPLAACLLHELAALGCKTTSLDEHYPPGKDVEYSLQGVQVITADSGEWLETHPGVLSEFDFIFNFPGNCSTCFSIEYPPADLRRNLTNTLALLENLRRIPSPARLVNISSGSVYGNPLRLPVRETDPTVPVSPLGVSLLAAERYVDVYNLHYKIPAINLRLFDVYGPGNTGGIVQDILADLQASPSGIDVQGEPQQMTDLLHILDAVQAILLAGEKSPARGEVYNVASGQSIQKADLVQLICRLKGIETTVNFSGKYPPGEQKDMVVDVHRIWSLGFSPAVSLEQGIARLLVPS